MVEDWKKELKKISKSWRSDMKALIEKLLLWKFDWLDVKKIQWKDNFFRCRLWIYRGVFRIQWSDVIIIKIWNRWDIYKWL